MRHPSGLDPDLSYEENMDRLFPPYEFGPLPPRWRPYARWYERRRRGWAEAGRMSSQMALSVTVARRLSEMRRAQT